MFFDRFALHGNTCFDFQNFIDCASGFLRHCCRGGAVYFQDFGFYRVVSGTSHFDQGVNIIVVSKPFERRFLGVIVPIKIGDIFSTLRTLLSDERLMFRAAEACFCSYAHSGILDGIFYDFYGAAFCTETVSNIF